MRYALTPAVVLLLFIVVVYCVLVLFTTCRLLVDLKVFAERQEQLQEKMKSLKLQQVYNM